MWRDYRAPSGSPVREGPWLQLWGGLWVDSLQFSVASGAQRPPLAQGHLLFQGPMCSEWSVWEDKGLAISSHPGSTQKVHPNSGAAHPLGRGWHWVCITAHLSLCPLLLPYPASQVLIPRVFPNQIHPCANLHLKICPLGPQPGTECRRAGGGGGR